MDNLNEEIERLSRIDYYPPEKRIGLALKMISDLRARLERAEVALRKALAICEVMYIGAGDTGTAGQFEAWGELVGYFRAALGAAGEEKDKGCQD